MGECKVKRLLGSMLILLGCSLCSNAVLTFSVTPPNEVPNSLPSEQQSPVLEENQNAQGVKVEVQKEEKKQVKTGNENTVSKEAKVATKSESENEKTSKIQKENSKDKAKKENKSPVTYPQQFTWTEAPKDLPEVEESEITLPEVIVPQQEKNENVGFVAGAVAWLCILVGVGIVLFVLFMNRRTGEFPVDTDNSKKSKKGRKKSAQYYR